MTLALVGCGKMGGAMLKGWQAAGSGENILVYDPIARHGDPMFCGTELFGKAGDFLRAAVRADTFVMAVKPQIMEEVCASLRPGVSGKALMISIAAGRTIESFKKSFHKDQPIIRAMPNTAAAIGKGITVAVACPSCTEEHRARANDLLSSMGSVEWVSDESLMDPVSALSGSGPAYVYFLIEVLTESGIKAGLDKEMAERLSRQMVIGSAALAEREADTPVSKLRENVTSPGGITAEALKILMSGDVQKAFDAAIKAAVARSRELSA